MSWISNQRVFVSGGAGVIGKPLVKELLDKGCHVFVGDLKMRPEQFPKEVLYRQGDLNDISHEEIAQFRPDCFIHLAATFERSAESYEFWEENFRHNMCLSHHLMSIFKEIDSLKSVVFASSYLIYDPNLYLFNSPQENSVKLNETDPIAPRNLTGCAKLNHEVELSFLNSFSKDKVRYINARIFRGFGKGSKDVISRWVRSALRGETIQVFSPQNRFDYIYAEDTAKALISLLDSRNAHGVYNVCTGKSHAVKDVVEVLKNKFPSLNEKNIPSESEVYEASVGDSLKITNETGWSHSFSLEEAIEEIVQFEKEQLLTSFSPPGNILITSISKKTPLIQSVKDAAKRFNQAIEVHGADASPMPIGRYYVDHFHQLPNDSELTFSCICELCKQYSINIIIPTRDAELPFYAENKNKFNAQGINVFVSDSLAVARCQDKSLFSEYLLAEGYPAIKALSSAQAVQSKQCVVKERVGSGSRNIGINISPPEALVCAQTMQFPIYQPFIEGREFSADVYVTNSGQVKGVVLRWREFIVSGESQITTTFSDEKLEEQMASIASYLGIQGHCVVQAIVDPQGELHVVEVNPRFGGASTLSLAVGLDSFYWFLLESHGKSLENYPYTRGPQKRLVRSPQDQVHTV